MNLRYISLGMKVADFDQKYRSHFSYHTEFMSDFLSKKIRKHKFETDGTFKGLSIRATEGTPDETQIVLFETLEAEVPFDQERYERIRGTSDCSYYLELFENGFREASRFKPLPLDVLLGLLQEFRDRDCKNEWMYKKKKFKEQDLEVRLDCYFTTLDFQLVATISRISTKEQLCSGTVIRTKPDEIHFSKMFKDILIHENEIIVTDASDSPRVIIDLSAALDKEFQFKLADYVPYDDEDDEDFEARATRQYVNRTLSYDGSGFDKDYSIIQ